MFTRFGAPNEEKNPPAILHDVTLLANPGFMRIKLSIHNAAQGVLLC